jgi:signal transduction histidine kinase
MDKHVQYLMKHFHRVEPNTLFEELKIQDLQVIEALTELSKIRRQLQLQNEELQIRNEQLQAHQSQLSQKHQELAVAGAELERLSNLKTEFLTNVSHELRTPLSIVKESILLLLDGVKGALNADQQRLLGSARSNVERLTHLINSLLDISHIETGQIEIQCQPVNVFSLMQELRFMVQAKAESKQFSFEIVQYQRQLQVLADPSMLKQAFAQLLDNAFKYTPRLGRVLLRVQVQGQEVLMGVEDNGPGIQAEDQQRIFDSFQQVGRVHGPGEHGTGLGLSITKQLVEKMRGRIWVDSIPGQGAAFWVALPLAQHQTLSENRPKSPLLERLQAPVARSRE